MGSGLQLPSMSEMFQQRRTAQQLTQELDGFSSSRTRQPTLPGISGGSSRTGTSARQQLIEDYARAGAALSAINGFLEEQFSDKQAGLANEGESPSEAQAPRVERGKSLPEPPAYFDEEGRKKWYGLLDDYTRASRQQREIPKNRFAGPEAQPGDPAVPFESKRDQPDGSTGYYTNESGSFYHLNPGDRYYGE